MLNLLPADWYCISPVQYLPRTSRTIFQINPPGLVYWREWCQMYTVCSSANYLWIKIWNLNEILCTDPLPAELYNSFLIKSKHLILNELPRLRRWPKNISHFLHFSIFSRDNSPRLSAKQLMLDVILSGQWTDRCCSSSFGSWFSEWLV